MQSNTTHSRGAPDTLSLSLSRSVVCLPINIDRVLEIGHCKVLHLYQQQLTNSLEQKTSYIHTHMHFKLHGGRRSATHSKFSCKVLGFAQKSQSISVCVCACVLHVQCALQASHMLTILMSWPWKHNQTGIRFHSKHSNAICGTQICTCWKAFDLLVIFIVHTHSIRSKNEFQFSFERNQTRNDCCYSIAPNCSLEIFWWNIHHKHIVLWLLFGFVFTQKKRLPPTKIAACSNLFRSIHLLM